jgi:hypothetical protein
MRSAVVCGHAKGGHVNRTRRQCKKCPWKVGSNAFDIPKGYDREKHCALKNTIAKGHFDPNATELRLMACHESNVGREVVCVGWLHNQLTEGNNVLLRLGVVRGKISADYRLDGEQHLSFEDTLPKGGSDGSTV